MMEIIGLIGNLCAAGVFITGAFKQWFIATGNLRPVYWMMIAMGGFNFILTLNIFAAVPGLWMILSFEVLVIWQIVMGIKGLHRLRNHERR